MSRKETDTYWALHNNKKFKSSPIKNKNSICYSNSVTMNIRYVNFLNNLYYYTNFVRRMWKALVFHKRTDCGKEQTSGSFKYHECTDIILSLEKGFRDYNNTYDTYIHRQYMYYYCILSTSKQLVPVALHRIWMEMTECLHCFGDVLNRLL